MTPLPTGLSVLAIDDGVNITCDAQAGVTFALEVSGDNGVSYHRANDGLANPLSYSMRHLPPELPFKFRIAANDGTTGESAFTTAFDRTTLPSTTILNFGRQGVLGVNLDISTYYHPRHFKDLMRQLEGFILYNSGVPTFELIDLRPDGWPASLASNRQAQVSGINWDVISIQHVQLPVTLRIKYLGAKLPAASALPVQIDYNGLWRDIPASGTDIIVTSLGQLGSLGVKITSTDPANPIRNIQIYEPIFEGTLDTDPWHPNYKALVARQGWVRALDFKNINGPDPSFGTSGDGTYGAPRIPMFHQDHIVLALLQRIDSYQNAAQTTVIYPNPGDVFVGDVSGNTGVYQTRWESRKFSADTSSENITNYNAPPSFLALSSPSGKFVGDTKISCAATGCVIYLHRHLVFTVASAASITVGNPTIINTVQAIDLPVGTIMRMRVTDFTTTGGFNADANGWWTLRVSGANQFELRTTTSGVVTVGGSFFIGTSYYSDWGSPARIILHGEESDNKSCNFKEPSWLELIILCNQTGANFWGQIPVPFGTSSRSWQATLIKNKLDKRLTWAEERANEIWNDGFYYTCGHYKELCRQAYNAGLNPAPPLAEWYGGGGVSRPAQAYVAMQDVAAIDTIFGAEASRVVHVLCDQNAGGPGAVGELIMPSGSWAPLGLSAGDGVRKTIVDFDAYAVAVYTEIAPSGTPQQITDQMIADLDAQGFVWLNNQAAYCVSAGKQLMLYEGGQQIFVGPTGPERVAWGKSIAAAQFQEYWMAGVFAENPTAVCHFRLYSTHDDGSNVFLWSMLTDVRHRFARFESHSQKLLSQIAARPTALNFTNDTPTGFRVNIIGADPALAHKVWTRHELAEEHDWVDQGTMAIGETYRDVTGLATNDEYDVAVAAIGTQPNGRSPYTNDSHSVGSGGPGVPGTPDLISATALPGIVGTTPIELEFVPGSGAVLTEVQHSTDADPLWEVVEDDATSEHVHVEADSGVTNYYRIRSWNAQGWGPYSTTRSALAYPAKPGAPVLTPLTSGSTQAQIPAGAATSHKLMRQLVSGGAITEVATGASATLVDTTPPVEGVAYNYFGIRVNASGPSELGVGAAINTMPLAPTLTSAIGIDDTTIQLTIVHNSANYTQFRVKVSTDNVTFDHLDFGAIGQTNFDHDGLPSGTQRWYQVFAMSGTTSSVASNVEDGTTTGVAPDPSELILGDIRTWISASRVVNFDLDAGADVLVRGTAVAYDAVSGKWKPWVFNGANGLGVVRGFAYPNEIELSATVVTPGEILIADRIHTDELIDHATGDFSTNLHNTLADQNLARMGFWIEGL